MKAFVAVFVSVAFVLAQLGCGPSDGGNPGTFPSRPSSTTATGKIALPGGGSVDLEFAPTGPGQWTMSATVQVQGTTQVLRSAGPLTAEGAENWKKDTGWTEVGPGPVPGSKIYKFQTPDGQQYEATVVAMDNGKRHKGTVKNLQTGDEFSFSTAENASAVAIIAIGLAVICLVASLVASWTNDCKEMCGERGVKEIELELVKGFFTPRCSYRCVCRD